MSKTLVIPPMSEEEAKRDDQTVKMDRTIVEMVRTIVQEHNRGKKPKEKITMSDYLSRITRDTVLKDYRAAVKKLRDIEPGKG